MMDNSLIEARTKGIRWLFQLIRIAAVIWAVWHIVRFVLVWMNRDMFLLNLGRSLNTDLSDANFALGYSTGLVALAFLTWLSIAIWRLFSSFLAGHLFTADSACEMRMIGMLGFATVIIDLGHRPLMYLAFQKGLLAKVPLTAFFTADDLLHLILAGMVFAIGCVFGSAVEASRNVASPPLSATVEV